MRSIRHFTRPPRSTSSRRQAARVRVEALESRNLLSFASTDLGTLGGGYTTATDLNASAQVVGSSDLAGGERHAFLWSGGHMIDLGTLGGTSSAAFAINDRGQVVGQSNLRGNDYAYRAFLLTPEDTDGDGVADLWFRDSNADGANDLMRDLGTLGGTDARSSAFDINNLGQVVGSSSWRTASGDTSRAVLWDQGVTVDLGTGGGTSSAALAINDAGVVVGSGYFTPGYTHALVWKNGAAADLGSSSMGALDVNASGQLVDTTFGGEAARLWTPTQTNGTAGAFTFLGALPSDPIFVIASRTEARGLNNAGAVVGSQDDYYFSGEEGSWGHRGAFLWAGGLMEELPLDYAVAINDAGQIVGSRGGLAVLLTPQAGGLPRITIGDTSVTEGNGGTTLATFTVTLSAASPDAITVAYATADGTATAGGDYLARSGLLTFAPGETSKTITVPVTGDRVAEPDETFVVNLSGATNAAVADGQGVATILDDEPRISIGDVTVAEGKKGKTTLFTFTVTLSAPYDEPVTTSFRTVDGTATAGDKDYVAKSGTLTFLPGETTKTITIEVKGDNNREPNEVFYVDLFNSRNSWFTRSRGVGTILNDDGGRLSLNVKSQPLFKRPRVIGTILNDD